MVLNFTTSRYALLFLDSEIYIVHVINCKWSRSVNFSLHMFWMRYKSCFSNINMSSKVMRNWITLSVNIRNTKRIKGNRRKFFLSDKVTIGREWFIFATKSFNDNFWITFYNNQRKAKVLSKIDSFHSNHGFYISNELWK